MLKRKNVGSLLIGTSIALGLFALAAAIVWWQQGMNVLIGSLVFILYGIGQWMTVLYWQRIQADWEETGEVLGRLQQAVSDIPMALDANLKSIAARLTEGQVQALAKLQGEVNEGARATLEKGALQIGDSLEKNLKQPLASLEANLLAWARQADTQSESSRALGEEMRKSQREGAEEAKRLAQGLAQDLKTLTGAQSAQADRLLSAWAERAAAAQSGSEARLAELRDALIADVTSKLREAQAAQGEAQQGLLAKALAGVEAQAKISQEAVSAQVKALQAAAAEQSQSLRTATAEQTKAMQAAASEQSQAMRAAAADLIKTWQAGLADQAKAGQSSAESQAQALRSASETFAESLTELKDTSLRLVEEVEAKASASLEAQSQLGLEVAGKVSELADRMRQGSQDVAELAHVAQINQTEMQAGVAMLNSGLSSILDRLEKQAAAGDGYQSLLAELGKTLADFQDRSAEVLIENALKTQEILMEVLRHQEGRAGASENALVAAQ
ncbi:MAG: hypothetical protein JF616_08540 [Fibrobacteres bacterium]|nr:hypothetical protein [Fibrobacterota bacterium]